MRWLISDFGLLSVVLRAGVLSGEALLLGGVLFAVIALRGVHKGDGAYGALRRFCSIAAIALLCCEVASVLVNGAVLQASTGIGWREVGGASFVWSGSIGAATALAAWIALRRGNFQIALVCCIGLMAAVVSGSHAVSELQHPVLLTAATSLHHIGTALWIGAMPFLMLALPRLQNSRDAIAVAKRYSVMAQTGVALLLLGGIVMSVEYVGSWPALYGTAYGLMLTGKVVLFCVLIALGAANYFLVRGLRTEPQKLLARLARFSEVEVGIGFTVILAAASLTSQPPARDLTADRLTRHELVQRMAPEAPRLKSPPMSGLSPITNLDVAVEKIRQGDAPQPNKAGDIAWSEYNHNWAGLIVLAAGFFALLARSHLPGTRWARHWPLAFLALAVFILLRADPENWPLGPHSFWTSLYNAETLQHRLSALLVAAFAWFEWRVQLGKVRQPWMRLVFPAVCAAGAALLLTHNHALGNIKEELLAEYSHMPIAIAGMLAGWGRWMEIRLPRDSAANRRIVRYAGLLWPVCLMVAGAVLLNYREG